MKAKAPERLAVIMSTEAWGDYEVPGSPFFVLVDGASARRIGEGVANHFSQVTELVRRAQVDVRPFGSGSQSRVFADGLDGPAASRQTTRNCWPPAFTPATGVSIRDRSPMSSHQMQWRSITQGSTTGRCPVDPVRRAG